MKQTNLSVVTSLVENRVGYMSIPGIVGEFLYKDIAYFRSLPVEEKYRIVSTATCEVLNCEPQRLHSKDRFRPLPVARNFCMYYLYIVGDVILTEIARLLRPAGKKSMNHTSIIHGRDLIIEALKPSNRDSFSEQIRGHHEQITSIIKKLIDESDSTNR